MFNKKNILVLFFTFFTTLAILITSCDINNPTDGLEVRLNTISRETIVTAFLRDAVDHSVIRQNVKVTFEGANSSSIIDPGNNPKTVFTTSSGYINFSVMDGTVFDENNPFTVNVRLESAGFETKVQSLDLFTKGIYSETLFMVNEAKLQAMTITGSVKAGSTDSNGSALSDIDAVTSSGIGIKISAGTVLKTSSGVPLVGELTTKVSTINAKGNNIAPLTVSDGTSSGIPIFDFSLDISDASGKIASSTDKPLVISLPVEETAINPATGSSYLNGENVLVFELDDSGNYLKIGEGQFGAGLQKKAAQLGQNSFTFSTFVPNLAHSTIAIGAELCKKLTKFQSAQSGLVGNNYDFYIADYFLGSAGGNKLLEGYPIYRVPINVPYRFKLIETIVASGNTVCGNNVVNFNLTNIPQGHLIKFVVNGICSDQDPPVKATLADAAFVYYPISNSNAIKQGIITGGTGSVTLLDGEYHLSVDYDDDTYTGNIIISDNGQTITYSGFDTSSLINAYGEGNTFTMNVRVKCK